MRRYLRSGWPDPPLLALAALAWLIQHAPARRLHVRMSLR